MASLASLWFALAPLVPAVAPVWAVFLGQPSASPCPLQHDMPLRKGQLGPTADSPTVHASGPFFRRISPAVIQPPPGQPWAPAPPLSVKLPPVELSVPS